MVVKMNNNKTVVLDLSREYSNFPLIVESQQFKRKYLRRNGKVPPRENRIMNKSGRLNIRLYKIPDKSIRFVRDLWNTMVNMRWRWIMVSVGLANVSAYLLLAALFLLDAWISRDFDNTEGHKMCINGITNFTSFFMLGIETITTTGYGYIHPTEYCDFVFVILTFSTLVTIFIDGAFISVVYVKFGRPSNAKNIFSKRTVITLRNGKLCLIFRINDQNGKHWINSRVNMYLIKDSVTTEGEILPNCIQELQIQPFGMLFVPVDVIHEITNTSPLWNISAQDLITTRFEILAIVSGNSTQTGQPSKSQTSYLSREMLWGYRFSSCLQYNYEKLEYTVIRKGFNQTLAYDTPLCNAQFLTGVQKEIGKRRISFDHGTISSDYDSTTDFT